MRIIKSFIIVLFVAFVVSAYFDFDINAMWKAAASNPFMFVFTIFIGGLLGFVAVNKFN